MDYILAAKEPSCFLCDMIQHENDRESLILERCEHSLVVFNKYPYNNGHLMVAPYRHVSSLDDVTDEEALDLMQATRRSGRILRDRLHADGFNIGINLGKAAGAGLEDHLHIHIVPRWNGDTNFMPVIADTKVIPQSMHELHAQLYPVFQSEKNGPG